MVESSARGNVHERQHERVIIGSGGKTNCGKRRIEGENKHLCIMLRAICTEGQFARELR